MFRQKKDEDPLKDLKGEQLGFLVSEIPPGRELVEVVTMAPKVYALKIKKEDGTFEYSVKVKGVTMNSGNSRHITFDSMKKAVSYSKHVKETLFIFSDGRLYQRWIH